jgi:PKD repeat protein
VNWSWDFGDGNNSYAQHPTHHYPIDGVYNVTLAVVDDNNESNTTWKLITVENAAPNPDFYWTPLNPTTQDLVQFIDNSTDRNVQDWFWEFGDGYSSTLEDPTHQYDEDGTYNVTLTVTDDQGAVNATTKTLIVSNVAPTASYTFSPTDPIINENISFNDTSSDIDGTLMNWTWDFGDGNTSYEQQPTHAFTSPGNYTVCLTVTDNDDDTDTHCSNIIVSSDEAILDVNQSVFNRGFPIRHAVDGDWAGAQNFTPTLNTISKIDLYLRSFGTPSFNLTIELRENSTEGTILDTQIFSSGEVPSSWSWFTVDFSDVTVDSDTDYFIVVPPAPSGVTNSFGYEWGYAFDNQYDDGSFWFTRDGGNLWRDLPTMYEFTFKTYGFS